jgi:hypothetical protein
MTHLDGERHVPPYPFWHGHLHPDLASSRISRCPEMITFG